MKVRCETLWVAVAIMVSAISMACPALATETKAIEVDPSSAESSPSTADGASDGETVATEVPVSDEGFKRPFLEEAAPVATEVAPGTILFSPSTGTAGNYGSLDELRHEVSALDSGVIRVGDTGSLYSMENRAYGTRMAMQANRSPMGYTPFGTPTRLDPETPQWKVRGSIAAGLGDATFADNDFYEFKLRESLTNLQGNYYEFYQTYLVDKSYVDASTLTVGAKQRFNEWLWNGDLRLTEEFKYYENKDYSANDRQEGTFALRFDPEWMEGRWKAKVDYKYRIRLYEEFSTRSYRYNSARTALTYQVAPDLAATGRYRYDDYNYSSGSTYSNNRQAVTGELDWEATETLSLTAGVTTEEKEYQDNNSRSYDKVEYDARLRWEPDCVSQVELRGDATDYQREFNSAEDYDDRRVSLRYRRDLSCELDIDLYGGVRRKEYVNDSTRDLDVNEARFRVNFNPNCTWNMYAGYGQADYDYATASRAYLRTVMDAGVSYLMSGWRAGISYNRYETTFDVNTDTDYTRDDLDLTVDYRRDANRWKLYYGLGLFNQVNPSSRNDYDETRLGLGWDMDLDDATRLKLSYDFNKRDYELFTDYEYSQVGAKIEFDL